MSIVQHIKVLDSQLANIKIVAGSTIYTRDTGKHFIDISDTERVQISDIIYIDTDKERTALLAPLPDKLYITRDTNKVWIYSVKSDKWVCLNIDTTYTAGTGININGTTINNSGVRAVTAGASANKINVNTNGNTNTITINNVANATSAGKATNDSAGQQINTTYIKGLSVSGKVITYTKGDGTTGTITTQDTNTWRGIQNVLTSDSTTDSLSAAQGKALKGLVDGKADKATTLSGYGITDAKISDGVITLGANSITPLTSHQSLAAYAKTADVNTALDKKANKATTLSGYGITDAKISDGTITLGSNTITPLTNHQSLANYYTKGAVDTLITNLKAGLVNVVESLPTTGENGKLYLVKTGSESENLYTEYVYVNKAWEKLGTQKLDLSGYLTKTDAANTYLGKTAAAASANKLNTNAGSATQPIYFANGVPVATTYTLGKSVPSDAKFTDTVYNHPTTHPASMITGLATVATSGSYADLSDKPTIPAAYSLPDATASVKGGVKVGSNITVSSGTISLTKANVTNALGYTPPTTDTNTHYTTGLIVGKSATDTANAAATNGNVFLNLKDDSTIRNSHKIVGSGATTVTSDASGNITISSTNTVYTHPSSGVTAGTYRSVTVNAQGHVTGGSNPTTLAGYGITDAKISNGTITLGSNTITPLTKHQSLDAYVTKATADATYLGKTATAASASKLALDQGTADKARPVIFQDSNLSTSVLTACYNNNLTYNPVSNNLVVGKINGFTIGASVPADAKFTDTVYSHPTTHPASMITGLATVATSGSYNDLTNKPTIPAAYSLPDATASVKGGVKVGSNITVSSGTISLTKANVTNALGYTPPTTNTDTHWTTGLKVGASATATANAAATNGNVFLNVLDNTTIRDSHNIVGSGATTVTSDANGKITISSTNTVYTHPTTHPASMITGLATVATSGSYNDLTNKPTIPAAYSLPDATTSVKGGVKIGSNLTVSSGTLSLTKANVVAALGYTPPTTDTNTTYSASNGISLSGTTVSNSGVRSIATGSANGTISVNTNGTSADVAVKGLGSAAYTASSAYAAAGHTHTSVIDSGNNSIATTFAYSKTGLTTASWLAAWNGSELRAIAPSVIKKLLDNQNRWVAVTHGLIWSRICLITPQMGIEGMSGILSVSCTRGNVVCNATFMITSSHSKVCNIVQIGANTYSTFQIRGVTNSNGTAYVEIYDSSNSIASGTAQSWHCAWTPLLESTLTPYTVFTSGATVPSDYTANTAVTVSTGKKIVADTFVGSLSGNASTATKATQDSAGQQINTTYIKGLSVSGTTITYTKGDGTTGTIKTQDTNTVYTHPTTHPASMITGLATVATSGSYNDLSNKPTSLPANGGNSTTANGIMPEWSGSLGYSDTDWICAWQSDGKKIKAMNKSAFATSGHTHDYSASTLVAKTFKTSTGIEIY